MWSKNPERRCEWALAMQTIVFFFVFFFFFFCFLFDQVKNWELEMSKKIAARRCPKRICGGTRRRCRAGHRRGGQARATGRSHVDRTELVSLACTTSWAPARVAVSCALTALPPLPPPPLLLQRARAHLGHGPLRELRRRARP
jgi:hypothetical protein